MVDGTVVSRNDLFGYAEESATEANQSIVRPLFDFIEVDVEESINEQPDEAPEENQNDEVLEFQLFTGSAPTAVSLAQPKEIRQEGRSVEYYIFRSSPAKRKGYEQTAVSGDSVIEEARFWQKHFAKRPNAPDINEDYVPKKRRCRPGKQARANRLLKNKRLEQERKEAQARFKNRRKGFQFHKRPKK